MGTAYAVLDNDARPPGTFPTRRGPARQRPTGDNPARLIANIFIPSGNIGGRGWGQERVGGGERQQGHEGGGGGGGAGVSKSEVWSGDSGGSDATLDVGSEEGKEEHAR